MGGDASASGRPAGGRQQRVAEAIRQELSTAIVSGEIRDPVVAKALVGGVEVSAGLEFAKVRVRTLGGAEEAKGLLAGCKRAEPRFRQIIAQALDLRRAPELRFVWDDQPDRDGRLEDLFAEIRAEAPRPSERKTDTADNSDERLPDVLA